MCIGHFSLPTSNIIRSVFKNNFGIFKVLYEASNVSKLFEL